MPRDLYEVLGVGKSADSAAIRSAHRKLVRKHHPDVDKSAGAVDRFKEIQTAYEVLSDAKQRANYDQFGHAGVRGDGGSRPSPSPRSRGAAGVPGGHEWQDIDPGMFNDVFGDIFGRGRSGGGGQRAQPRPAEFTLKLTVPFEVAALGGVHSITFDGAAGRETLDVRIPSGIEQGGQLRLKGKAPATGRGERGDLLLLVDIAAHPYFRREGLDIIVEVPISIAEATLGGIIEVPLLRGTVEMRVPAGTASGKRLRVKSRGITNPAGETGDFYALLQTVPPTDLSAEEAAQLRGIDARHGNPRDTAPWH
ncbi:MAG: J domain-containing protein [Phycisphaerales bacterium]|nr:J domain-containing protein [Phycisphaerales bacterium]